ncbi:hypothetical protein HOLleu_25745 [Holothuria leucospilota]|uniref:Uncharacterized protein n=1 Tax=Holothuria leucospilota TaxID=206669 RepID=A0A9Q1H3P9_HOLLE|nr:hypothetical protein HOLleu_25745 [Holothuria leucospilota]
MQRVYLHTGALYDLNLPSKNIFFTAVYSKVPGEIMYSNQHRSTGVESCLNRFYVAKPQADLTPRIPVR